MNKLKMGVCIALCVGGLIGCSDSIDLYEPREVIAKITIADARTRYELENDTIWEFNEDYIYAGQDFAKVGDIIRWKDGVIKVINAKEGENRD